MKIPKIIHQVWIGPLPMPEKWMDTWKKHNPTWKYVLWDNKKVFKRKWRNQWMIDEYIRQYNEKVKRAGDKGEDLFISAQGATFRGDKATGFAWHVIADIIRYEILYEYGGYMPGSDSECLKPIDGKFADNSELYIVNTGNMYYKWMEELIKKYPDGKPTEEIDKIRWHRYNPNSAAPIAGCKKKHPFVGKLINELSKLTPEDLGEAVDTTGNAFIGRMIEKHGLGENHTITYYRKGGLEGDFPDNQYSLHHSGTTNGCYKKGRYIERDVVIITTGKTPTLEYVIRSIEKNLEHRKLVIVGPAIKGIKPDIHINVKDTSDNPIVNVAKKLLAVAKDKRVHKNIIVMDDDIFLMKPYSGNPMHKGLLRKNIKDRMKKGMPMSDYWKAAHATLKVLSITNSRPADYTVHCPMEMTKSNILAMEKKYKITRGEYLIKTIYGNEYITRAIKAPAIKVRDYTNPELSMISTVDKIEETEEFQDYMQKQFPNKSKYEIIKRRTT